MPQREYRALSAWQMARGFAVLVLERPGHGATGGKYLEDQGGCDKAMTLYFILKYLHVLGVVVILGTGIGIAFFMLMAHRSGDAAFVARTAETAVIADMLFTLTAVILQPITGGWLMALSSTSMAERWLMTSLGLYVVAGLFWIPVIFMQIEMRDLARAAAAQGQVLPARYVVLFRRWFAFGIPGFGSVMIILWLMIAKPQF